MSKYTRATYQHGREPWDRENSAPPENWTPVSHDVYYLMNSSYVS